MDENGMGHLLEKHLRRTAERMERFTAEFECGE